MVWLYRLGYFKQICLNESFVQFTLSTWDKFMYKSDMKIVKDTPWSAG